MKPEYNGYQLTVVRDAYPESPLSMTEAPIMSFSVSRGHGASSPDEHLIYALAQDTDSFLDYLNDHRYYCSYYDLHGLTPVKLDWNMLEGCHPDDGHDTDQSSEAADNAALLAWAGVPQTRENIYSDTPPDALVSAIHQHLRDNVYVFETISKQDGERYLWAEREVLTKWSGNPMDDIEAFADEYRAYITGNVWEFTLTEALYDDDGELVEVDDESSDSCGGFYGELTSCITHALPEYAADALKAHCGNWLEECTINIVEATA